MAKKKIRPPHRMWKSKVNEDVTKKLDPKTRVLSVRVEQDQEVVALAKDEDRSVSYMYRTLVALGLIQYYRLLEHDDIQEIDDFMDDHDIISK